MPSPPESLIMFKLDPTIQPMKTVNSKNVRFIRENKSSEKKSVEILVFGVYENPLRCAKYIRSTEI